MIFTLLLLDYPHLVVGKASIKALFSNKQKLLHAFTQAKYIQFMEAK
jgi:hypothetical protein